MTTQEKINGRKIGVIGMARSGVAAALLARQFDGDVFVTDHRPQEKLAKPIAALEQAGISYETGAHSDQILASDYVIISPGVPLTSDLVFSVRERAIPIFSELEFASWVCRGKIIAVTGSNGKTTTTTLLGEIFKAAHREAFVCGNIGQPFAEIAPKVSPNGCAIVEVSSFQLETIDQFQPDIALILNLTPDHLDRHGTFETYRDLKFRITENQTDKNLLIINADDPILARADITTAARKTTFSIDPARGAATACVGSRLQVNLGVQPIDLCAVGEIMIQGRHNLANAAAAALAALEAGVPVEPLVKALRSFPGVEHRLENIGKIAGIQFINDSKATNVSSTVVALQAMTTGVHLILGGKGKGASYTPLAEVGKGRIKSLVLIGEDKNLIYEQLGNAFSSQLANSLEEAVTLAFQSARPGETILLSPACASFDMFENYEQRGQAFKAAVKALKSGKMTNGTLTNH